MSWFAHLVQAPSESPAFSLYLKGHGGFRAVSVVESIFKPIFGSGYRLLERPWQIAGRLGTADKILAVMGMESGKYAYDLVKNRGTPFSHETRLAFVGIGNVSAFAMMLSEHFFTLTPSGEKNCDPLYFDALFNEIENGGREAFLYDLIHYGHEVKAA